MVFYAKLRAWIIWLFWFYIRYGKEMPRRKALWIAFASVIFGYLGYESLLGQFSHEPGFSFRKVSGYIFIILLPSLILGLYGYLFGHRHSLEPLDPAYTRPNPLEPIGISLALVIIALARWHGWW